MQIKQDFIPEGRLNKPIDKINPKYITVHDTGINDSTAKDHADYLKTTNRAASWHFTVDDVDIYQHLKLTDMAYHAKFKGNHNSIGIEICQFKDPVRRAKAEANAIWLIRYLLAGEMKGAQVVQHYFWTGKNCPNILRARPNGWENFLKEIYKTIPIPIPIKPNNLPEIIRALEVTFKRANQKMPITAQINYLKKIFDEYLKNGGK